MNYRSFLNSDPPGLANVWQQQRSRSTANYVTAQLLEDFVFSKPYFDKDGLIVAEQNGQIVAFCHAAFGPNDDRSDIQTDVGVTCVMMVLPDVEFAPVAEQLIQHAEDYLHNRGAKLIYAGSVDPINPYYLGFYGGSELPGVVASDSDAITAYQKAGYKEIDRCVILSCDLAQFKAPVDRKAMTNKRLYSVRRRAVGPASDWWEACTRPPTEMTMFEVIDTTTGQSRGSVCFWLIEPLSTSRRAPIAGLTKLVIAPEHRRQGLATFLNSEALKTLHDAGISWVEVQTMQDNKAALGLYKKLGFREIDCGIIFRKSAA